MYCVLRPTRRLLAIFWLVAVPVTTYASWLPPPPDEEGERWRTKAIEETRANWTRFAIAVRAGDKLVASLLFHPNSRVKFLLESPDDLTKASVPVPALEDQWVCSITGREPLASCRVTYVNANGQSEQMEVPFCEKDGVWYLTY